MVDSRWTDLHTVSHTVLMRQQSRDLLPTNHTSTLVTLSTVSVCKLGACEAVEAFGEATQAGNRDGLGPVEPQVTATESGSLDCS